MTESCPVCGEEYLPTSVNGDRRYICESQGCRVVAFRTAAELKQVVA